MGKLSLPFITMATEADVIQGQKGQALPWSLAVGTQPPVKEEAGHGSAGSPFAGD